MYKYSVELRGSFHLVSKTNYGIVFNDLSQEDAEVILRLYTDMGVPDVRMKPTIPITPSAARTSPVTAAGLTVHLIGERTARAFAVTGH